MVVGCRRYCSSFGSHGMSFKFCHLHELAWAIGIYRTFAIIWPSSQVISMPCLSSLSIPFVRMKNRQKKQHPHKSSNQVSLLVLLLHYYSLCLFRVFSLLSLLNGPLAELVREKLLGSNESLCWLYLLLESTDAFRPIALLYFFY